jgi:4-hydroxy-3-methylbut-2-enyl diphosphate reductase
MGRMSEGSYFQKGLGLKAAVAPLLAQSYHSRVVDRVKELGHAVRAGDLTLKLAREFGFCYGVDRAVEYAYETRERFPDRRIFLSGEIIHNADVNGRLEQMGIRILREAGAPELRYAELRPEDVLLMPAFGVTASEFEHLRGIGCVLVDTTCGSVLNVWKNVRRYTRDGFTSVIHGKHHHEETRATASQGSPYLCVRDRAEAELVCEAIRGRLAPEALIGKLGAGMSPGFDPERDLGRIGLANQTTMLMSESLEVQGLLRQAMIERWGEAALEHRFRAFDTICSATQDRQDAVIELLERGALDRMLVIGGYNSSNTMALTRICLAQVPTWHIAGPTCVEGETLRHQPLGEKVESRAEGWLPRGPLTLGLTAGASTPNSLIGAVIERVLAVRGLAADDLAAA